MHRESFHILIEAIEWTLCFDRGNCVNALLIQSQSSAYQHSSCSASTFFLWVFHWEDQTNKAKSWQHPLSSRSNCCARYSNTSCSVSEKEVHNVLKKTAQKTCKLDPLPVLLLYENIDLLLPALTNIINRSLLAGEFPSKFFLKMQLSSHYSKRPAFIPTKWRTIAQSRFFHFCQRS